MKKLLAFGLMLFSMVVNASPVNVNTADAATIADALHGIGLKKAQEIVNYREANGAFKSLEDLANVKGIGDKTIAKNQADILFSGAGAAPVAAAPKAPKAPKKAAPVAAAPAAAPVAAPAAVVEKAAKAPAAAAASVAAPAVAAPAAAVQKVTKDLKAAVPNPLK